MDVLVQFEHAEHQDPGARQGRVGTDAARGVDTVAAGHPDVHEDEVGAELPGAGDGGLPGVGLPHDGEIRGSVDDEPEAVADEGLVVHDQYPDGVRHRYSAWSVGSGRRAVTR